MSKKFQIGTKLCRPRNLKKIRTANGCEFACTQTLEKVYYEDGKIVGGEVVGFIDKDGDIFSIADISSVLWVDVDRQTHWIWLSEYQGEFDYPENEELWGCADVAAHFFSIRPYEADTLN